MKKGIIGLSFLMGLFLQTMVFAFEPDHYISYNLRTGNSKQHKIALSDQFIDWSVFLVEKPIRLLNPSLKRHNDQIFEIKNPKLHYTAYPIRALQDVVINEKVHVSNQIGEFDLDTFRPERLLVPSYKIKLSANHIPKADHYLCYEIPAFTVTTPRGFLRDQFRSREFSTLIARRICNPVRKLHNDKISDIISDEESNHLMCFELEKASIFKIVALHNQFDRLRFAVATSDDEICVPSKKTKAPEPCGLNANGECSGICTAPGTICGILPGATDCGCFQS